MTKPGAPWEPGLTTVAMRKHLAGPGSGGTAQSASDEGAEPGARG
ncbi:MAG TPA: hypothetical protein VFZ66_27255 [Herpetosiphonaceae bacterium]